MAEPSSPPPVTSPSLATTPPPPSPPHSPWTSLMELNPDDDNDNDNQCCCDDEFILCNSHNFGLSDVPMRIMFYMNKCWHDFDGEALESLCYGFASGMTLLPLKIEGVMFAFDFLRMLQVHLCSKNRRSIAWVDKKGNPFFPIRFIDHDFSQSPLNGGGIEQESLALTSKFPNAKLLRKSDKTYVYTRNLLFLSKISKVDPQAAVTVTDIHEFQISGSHGMSRWEAFEKQIVITEAARGNANVVFAWYAAPVQKVASIFSHGFELLPNPPTIRPSIGAGIFLAGLESPQYSGMQYPVHNDPEKHLILCRVVLGSVEIVELEFHQVCASREEFDTGSDNPNNPKWYVVWADDINKRILPVCVVSCKTSAIVAVEWRKLAFEIFEVPKLMLEMKKRIPIAIVPALHDIYDSLKKQRVTIEMFQKQIRALVGDQILLQIAKENY